MNKTIHTNILIIGNGLAGSTAANALLKHPSVVKDSSSSGQPQIHVIDRNTPSNTFEDNQDYDLRVISLNRGSEHILRTLDIWKHINLNRAFPYRFVEVDQSSTNQSHHMIFDCQEIGLSHMGQMIETQHVVHALQRNLSEHKQLCRLHYQVNIQSIEFNHELELWTVITKDTTFQCNVLIGADGQKSLVRQAANIDISKGFYHQRCLVGNITVDGDLRSTAWQTFLNDGPLGILPMKVGDRTQQFSLAWSCDNDKADELLSLFNSNPKQFISILESALPKHYGSIVKIQDIKSFPLTHQHSENYYSSGLALIGDAAHSIHPLAGLGANIGIRDAAILVEELFKVEDLHQSPIIQTALLRYEKRTKDYNALILNLMGIFKSSFGKNPLLPEWISLKLMKFGNNLPLIKNQLTKYATGLDNDSPKL